MTITATSQGILNVPMYSAPFTIPTPDGSSPVGIWASTGESVIFGYTVNGYSFYPQLPYNNLNGAWTNGVGAGTWYGSNYGSAYKLVVGNGTAAFNGGQRAFKPSPLMFDGLIVFQNMHVGSTSLNPFPYTYNQAYSYTQFQSNISLPQMYCRDTTGAGQYSSNEYFDGVAYGVNRVCINLFATLGNIPPYIVNVSSIIGLGSLFGGVAGDTVLQCDLLLSGQAASNALNLPFSQIFISKTWINPAPASTNNFLWVMTTTSGMWMGQLSVNYSITAMQFTPFAPQGFQQWNTDNATINAALLANTVSIIPCPNGFILSLNSGAADYFVTKDGLKYWQLNLQVQNPSALKNGRTSIPNQGLDNTNSRWIDAAGIVWYTGIATQDNNGGFAYPLYSLALNIPNNPPQINLNFPPIAGDCWSPCLDRIGGRPGNLNPTGN